MNIFRLTGDFLHLFAILYLLVKLIRTKSCGGFSGKTQMLFAILYSARYIDLFNVFISVYNTAFKLTYIICYYVSMLLIFIFFRQSYRKDDDTFATELLLIPCMALALVFNHGMSAIEILWSFSIFLESVAVLPQLYMIHKTNRVEKSVVNYLIPLGLYRLFYIFNWIFRHSEEGLIDGTAYAAGLVYIVVYIFALMEFCISKVQIVNEESPRFLKKNIFFVTTEEPAPQQDKNEGRKVDKQQLLVEKLEFGADQNVV